MNTITSFFAGIVIFVSSLFGHTPVQQHDQSAEQPVAIVSSAPVIQATTTVTTSKKNIQPATNTSEGYDLYDRPDHRINKQIMLLNNDPYATIARDFKPVFIYTTKNNKKIYFIQLSETVGSPACVSLYYFDIMKKMYNEIKNGYCPRTFYMPLPEHNPKEDLPLLIQEGEMSRENWNSLYAFNLETGTRTLLYTNTNPNESLISGCYYIDATYEYITYSPHIEYTNDHKLKISIYKNIGQNGKNCTYQTQATYEKIRDDIIDLSKIP